MRESTFRLPCRMRVFLIVVPAVVVLAMADGAALGCPNCKDAVNTTDPDGLNLARGYFYSILLMLAMPFTLAGSFGCYVWREMRRQQREQAPGTGDMSGGGVAGDRAATSRAFVEPHP
jgi:hypothetical protein